MSCTQYDRLSQQHLGFKVTYPPNAEIHMWHNSDISVIFVNYYNAAGYFFLCAGLESAALPLIMLVKSVIYNSAALTSSLLSDKYTPHYLPH